MDLLELLIDYGKEGIPINLKSLFNGFIDLPRVNIAEKAKVWSEYGAFLCGTFGGYIQMSINDTMYAMFFIPRDRKNKKDQVINYNENDDVYITFIFKYDESRLSGEVFVNTMYHNRHTLGDAVTAVEKGFYGETQRTPRRDYTTIRGDILFD